MNRADDCPWPWPFSAVPRHLMSQLHAQRVHTGRPITKLVRDAVAAAYSSTNLQIDAAEQETRRAA